MHDMPLRRGRSSRKALRRRRPRPALPSVAAAIVVIAIIGVAFVVLKQYGGYFTGHRARHIVANASPNATAPTGVPTPVPPSPSASAKRGPMVAIIIDDCGYNVPRDVRFLKLPVPITLSILPLTPHGTEVAAAARAA